MNRWSSTVVILLLGLGATGCATSGHREIVGSPPVRPATWSKSAVPAQNQVALPPAQPDVFASAPTSSRFDKYRLSHYFPGFARPVAPATTAPTATQVAAAPAVGQERFAKVVAPGSTVVAATSARPSWFGLRKPSKVSQTYMTDVRPSPTARGGVEPSFLPIALQLPSSPVADRSVLATSAEVTATNEAKPAQDSAPLSTNPAPSPANPDASNADASPLSTTEPRLAVPPIRDVQADLHAKPATEPDSPPKPELASSPEPEPATVASPAPTTSASDEPPATKEEDSPKDALRGRPRMPSTATGSYAVPTDTADPATSESKEGTPAPQVAARPSESDDRTVKATPSAADPSNSLGLPSPTLPASYTRHDSVAVRGSSQGMQPPPVLASPQVAPSSQVAPSPQSATTATPAKKTWRRPCLRRLIRRVCNLGEFANPPTAKPH